MKCAVVLSLFMFAGLSACGRPSSLYADRSSRPIAPAASPLAPPRFIGRWAASTAGCGDPWLFEARRLSSAAAQCEFGKVESSPAGYAINGICTSPAGSQPTRLFITTPDEPQIALMTVSGGPFRDATALQRCLK